MHENYPEALKIWNRTRKFSVIFKNYYIAKQLDSFCQKRADKIIVVVKEMKGELISKGIIPNKIHIVSNTVDYEYFTSFSIDEAILNNYKDDFMILYLGSFSEDRGLDMAIRGMQNINKHIPDAKLVLVGDGPNIKKLKALVNNLDLSSSVAFPGWVDFKSCPSYIKASKICIIPQPANVLIDNTIPHKLFQYMAMKRPVIVSDAKPLARIVKNCGCGEIFRSNSTEDFLRAILKMCRSDIKYGKNGQEAVMEKYNWDVSSKELVAVYKVV